MKCGQQREGNGVVDGLILMDGLGVIQMRLVVIALSLVFFITKASDSAIFALTWMAGHCTTLGPTCDRIKYEQWDHQSFTIHGLWPSQQSYRDFGDFNFQLFKKPLLEEMYNYWPPQPKTGGLPHFLWQFQWQKHGNSFSELMLDAIPRQFSLDTKKRNQELQVYYFSKVIQFYKGLNVVKVGKRQYTKQEFSALTKIPTNSFYFVCNDYGTFLEVRICVRVNGMDFRSCYKSDSNCPGGYAVLKDWRDNKLIIKELQTNDIEASQLKAKSKDAIYVPIAERKQDDKIQIIVSATKQAGEEADAVNSLADSIVIIGIQTEKHREEEKGEPIKSEKEMQKEVKQKILRQIEAQQLQEIAMQILGHQQHFEDVDAENGPISQAKVVQIVQVYMFLTVLLVSIFWLAIFILCLCIFRKNKQQQPPQADDIQQQPKTENFSHQQIK